MDRQVVEDHGLEVALRVGGAIKRGAASNKHRVSLKREGGSRWVHCFLCAHNFFCWKIARVASAEGGDHVAFCLRRQRSESEARMLITTVRLSGCSGLEVLKSLAAARCWSLLSTGMLVGAGAMSGPGPEAAAADCMTAGSM